MLAITNRKILTVTILIISLVLFLSYYFLLTKTLFRGDHLLMDLFFNMRGPEDPGKDIVIVALDHKSAEKMQRKASGWKRVDFARAIEILTEAGADLIAIDYIFAIADVPEQDEALRSAMEKSVNVILASIISEQDSAVPFDQFRGQEVGEGFINTFPDKDGTVRKIASLKAKTTEAGDLILTFPFSVQIALSRLYPDGDFKVDLSKGDHFELGDLKIPFAGREATDGFFINFAGPPEHFPRKSIHEILEKDFQPADIRGKIILIGNMNPLEHDYYPVPFKPGETGEKKRPIQSMYGIEIHANAIRTLLNRNFIAPVSPQKMALILLVFAIAAGWLAIGAKWNAFLVSGISVLLLVAFWLASFRLFTAGIFLPASSIYFAVIAISLTGLVGRQAEEAAQKRYITQLFGRYVAPNVVKELIRHRDLVQFNGRKQRLSIFFSDIRGFTSMSEKMKPEDVSALLNEYFSHMTRIVFKHGGTLDKFMGDAIMAFFGNPLYFPDHAEKAVEMALEMKEEMQRLRKKWADEGKESSFDIGMGINLGEVVVGNLGSNEFFDYTVIGDEVNLACRLESIAKRGQIIISENTYEEVKDKFDLVRLEPVTVKGKSLPVQIYEVVGRKK